MNGSMLPFQYPNPSALISSEVGGCGVLVGGCGVIVTHLLQQTPLEIFQMLRGDTQRVKLFICSKLFICVFKILNPGGPLISIIF